LIDGIGRVEVDLDVVGQPRAGRIVLVEGGDGDGVGLPGGE